MAQGTAIETCTTNPTLRNRSSENYSYPEQATQIAIYVALKGH